jgi:integrase
MKSQKQSEKKVFNAPAAGSLKPTEQTEETAITIPSKRADAHEWLLGFKEIKENWLEEVKGERTGSERTAGTYLDLIVPFCQFMNATPAEIVAKGAEETKKDEIGGLQRKTWADRTALAFFNWLQEKAKTKKGKPWTRQAAKGAYGCVRSFLRYNGFQFKGKTPIAQTQTTTKLPSNEQLASAWKMATQAQKLACGLLRSTMWRPEDILALTYDDLQEQYDAQRFYIEKVTQKEELPVGVYLTAETTEIVRLTMRKRYGDKKPKPTDRVLDYNYNNLLVHVQNFGENVGLAMSPKYFRKMGRTRCTPVIGQDALFKMAGWALPGVGRNYVLPSPEDTLKCYLQIETLLTFEPKAVSDKEQRRDSLIDAAIAEGILTPEVAQMVRNVWREKALSPEEAAVEIAKMRKQHKPAGMLNSEQVAAREFAKILMEALKQVRKMTKNQT